ncbi:MAG: hypothetical protein GXY45_11885, partial [Ramlibacter sp.]|nr:hypothetical protein [Ramlibacter sp.]
SRNPYTAFEEAVALAPEDPAVSLAVALALLSHNQQSAADDVEEDEDPLAVLQALLDESKAGERRTVEIEKYLRRTVEIAPHDHPAYTEAAKHLCRRLSHQGKIGEALTLQQTVAAADPDFLALAASIARQAVMVALSRVTLLLRVGELDQAQAILDLCAQAAPDLALRHLLQAELLVLRRDKAAEAAYRQVLAAAQNPDPTPIEYGLAEAAWRVADQVEITCPRCGTTARLEKARCGICDQVLEQHDLLIDCHELAGIGESVAASTALAVLLHEQGDTVQALSYLAQAFAGLPDGHEMLEDLRAVRAEWQALCSPAPEHQLAQAAFAAWRAQGLTPEVLGQVHQVCAVAPEMWPGLPVRDRTALVRSFLKAGELALAGQLLHTAFTDDPNRKSVKMLEDQLEEAVQSAVAVLLEKAQHALSANQAEEALAQAEAALQLNPADLHAQLLRAEAQLGQGNILAALRSFRAVETHSTDPTIQQQARLGAARSLENRWELEAALDLLASLDGETAQVTRERVLRKQRGEPAVVVRAMSDIVMHDTLIRTGAMPHCAGYFAVRVNSVRRPWDRGPRAWGEHILAAGFEFVQMLSGLRNIVGDPIFALRLIAHPDPAIPERGRLDAALLVRISAAEADECQQLALEFWRTVRNVLPLAQDFVYNFEPVADEQALLALLQPFEPAVIAEIVHRESVPRLDADRYAVHPFTPGSMDLHSLCWALLRQPAPSMLSVHLLPTDLMAWEHAALDRMMVGERRLASGEVAQLPPDDPASQWWQSMQLWDQTKTNRRLVDTLRSQAYVMGVTVAGSAGSSTLLPEAVAATLFGPARSTGESTQGGYEIIRAAREDEIAVCRRNLAELDVERWVYSAAPEGAVRVRHLVGESEAALTFRLPIPGPEGVPGIACLDAPPVAPPSTLPRRGTVLGESIVRVSGAPLWIAQALDDRRRHAYVVGKTGTGKSTLLKYMALQDIEAGRG